MHMQTGEPGQAIDVMDGGLAESTAPLVRNLAHELRQPLSVIETAAFYAEMVLAEGDSRVAEQLQKIQTTVQQMNGVLCDLVFYARAIPACGERVALSEAVMDAVADVSATGDGGDMEWRDLSGAPVARMDAGHARHMLRNILSVFLHLSGRQHPVNVSLTGAGDVVHLEFATQSSGALRGPVELLFEPFTPLLPSGMGLALAAVRRIAETHGGSARFIAQVAPSLRLRVALPAH